jgi:pimeloyl-ACP methyl ester carboxylesterase
MTRLLFGLMAAAALNVSCASKSPRADAFTPCADAGAFVELSDSLCATVSAPLDHAKFEGPQIDLFVRKFPAPGRARGQIWLVAGGPGESGASFYPMLATLRRSFPDYHLIAPDHRGTGYSGKLCPIEEAPSSAGGISLEGEEWGSCIHALHQDVARTRLFTITNAARDLAMLIETQRAPGRNYVYGVSYGTQLVLRMMQAAPPKVDGIILDSLIPPEGDARWDISHRTQTSDAAGRRLLTTEETAAYQLLLITAAAQPAWLARIPGADLKEFMGSLLDFPQLRARIPMLLETLTRGETSELERVMAELEHIGASLNRYPQSPPSVPLVSLISSSENNARPGLSAETVAMENEAALFTSPLAGYLVDSFVPLYERDGFYGALPSRMPRTLVLQGSLDPKTPIAGARRQIEALRQAGEIELSEIVGAPHWILFMAPGCFEQATISFLEELPAINACPFEGLQADD